MVLKAKEIREFTKEERYEKLDELKRELMHERGVAAMGGSPPSPGRNRSPPRGGEVALDRCSESSATPPSYAASLRPRGTHCRQPGSAGSRPGRG